MWDRPLVLGGDFSVIRFPNEKRGGCAITFAMWNFSDWISFNNLVDLSLGGADFTWSNIRVDPMMF